LAAWCNLDGSANVRELGVTCWIPSGLQHRDRPIQRSLIGGAIAFTAFGFLFGPAGLGLLQLAVQSEGLRLLVELALALVLFTDAANVEVRVVEGVRQRGVTSKRL
jgi:hypothetical protein